MNKLTINRQNGNIPKSLPGEDHVSGLLFYVPSGCVPTAFGTDHVQAVSTIDKAVELGISGDDPDDHFLWTMYYHLRELFRVNPGVELYVGIFGCTESSTPTYAEVKTMQNFANGRIRQIGIWDGQRALSAQNVQTLQAVCDALDAENAPLVALLSPGLFAATSTLPVNLSGSANRVSVVIGADVTEATEYVSHGVNDDHEYLTIGSIGVVLGLVSKAAVHEQIGWVKKFPTGITNPGFIGGALLRDMDAALISQFDYPGRYIFFTTYPGVAGVYVNDSHNMDDAKSDYCSIEAVRTMDKAVRGIRTYVTPELGGTLYIDKETGKLKPYTVAHLETVAGRALEDMEKAGELSGYKVEIDPDQNVLATSTVEILIKNVPVGVMRKVNINIGFYPKV